MRLAFIFALVFLGAACGFAQSDPPPGSIKLLPGYVHHHGQGIDSTVGTIGKEAGLRIHYDIGPLAGNYAECSKLCGWTDNEVWRKKQIVSNQEVICVFTKEKRLVISFPKATANFYATIRSQEDMADMLLMVLTFHSSAN